MSTPTPPETSSLVSPLESILKTNIVNHFLLGCHNYSVPAHVRQHIDLIQPTVQFNHRPSPLAIGKRAGGLGVPTGRNGPKKSSKGVTVSSPSLSTCDEMITLDCLRALYSVDYTPVETSKNSYGIGMCATLSILSSIVNSLQSNLHLKHFWLEISISSSRKAIRCWLDAFY